MVVAIFEKSATFGLLTLVLIGGYRYFIMRENSLRESIGAILKLLDKAIDKLGK